MPVIFFTIARHRSHRLFTLFAPAFHYFAADYVLSFTIHAAAVSSPVLHFLA
jgi:hypothetical protein